MPVIRTANPRKMVPMDFLRSWPKVYMATPTKPSSGAQASGLSIWMKKLSPCRPVSESSQEVTVVPMLAPMMTPIAWCSCIRPELTKPTAMTVVALEDWMTAVTTRPSRRPRTGDAVILLRMPCSLPPAICSRDLPMTSMPYKNKARPPSSVKTLNTLIPGYTSILSYFPISMPPCGDAVKTARYRYLL